MCMKWSRTKGAARGFDILLEALMNPVQRSKAGAFIRSWWPMFGRGALSDRRAEAGGGGSYTAQKGLGNTARKQIRRGGSCSGNVKPLQVKSLCTGGEIRTGAPWGSVQTQHSSAEPSRGRKGDGMKEPLRFLSSR